jgi:hypothetical protein
MNSPVTQPPYRLPRSFYPGPNETAIRAARAAAVAAGGGVIYLPDATITLAAALPCDSGVSYIGVKPRFAYSAGITERDWSFSGGTVLQGDGTFCGFAQNNTGLGSPAANFLSNAVSNFVLEDIGFYNFSSAIQIGAANNFGLAYSRLRNLFILSTVGFGIDLTNFHHLEAFRIFTNKCGHGQRYAGDVDNTVLSCGNSWLTHLVDMGLVSTMLNRGIVFEALDAAILNEIFAQRIQGMTWGRTQISQTATFNGTSTVAVQDGTKFAVGLPVAFSATSFGLTTNRTYLVLSVSGNNITIGSQKAGPALTPTAGTLTIKSWGMPNMEASADSTSSIQHSYFLGLDLENNAAANLYVENAGASHFDIREINNDPTGVQSNVVLRNSGYCDLLSNASTCVTDIDANSSTSSFSGSRGTTRQYYGVGQWNDSIRGTHVMSWSGSSVDMEVHNNSGPWLAPQIGMGQASLVSGSSSLSLAGFQGSICWDTDSSDATYTLPAITASSTAGSMPGTVYEITNAANSANTLTINTSSSQTFNRQGSKTSLVLSRSQSVRLIAKRGVGGDFYWQAILGSAVL